MKRTFYAKRRGAVGERQYIRYRAETVMELFDCLMKCRTRKILEGIAVQVEFRYNDDGDDYKGWKVFPLTNTMDNDILEQECVDIWDKFGTLANEDDLEGDLMWAELPNCGDDGMSYPV